MLRHESRLVPCQNEDEAGAAASGWARPVPTAEKAADHGACGRDRKGREGAVAPVIGHDPPMQLTDFVTLDAVASSA